MLSALIVGRANLGLERIDLDRAGEVACTRSMFSSIGETLSRWFSSRSR